MDKKEFVKSIQDNAERICDKVEDKNGAYTGGNDDPFFNFKRREPLISAPMTIFSRMGDKDGRIEGIMGGHRSNINEPLKETLDDLIGYGLIWLAYIESQEDDV